MPRISDSHKAELESAGGRHGQLGRHGCPTYKSMVEGHKVHYRQLVAAAVRQEGFARPRQRYPKLHKDRN